MTRWLLALALVAFAATTTSAQDAETVANAAAIAAPPASSAPGITWGKPDSQLRGSEVLYDNGGLATGATAGNGTAAPAGTQWSELQNDAGNTTEANGSAGFSCSVTTGATFRCADNFTVPAGATWTIDFINVYGYQTGYAGGASPYIAGTLRVLNGPPNDPASTVLAGDETTNALAQSVFTNLYRLFSTTTPAPGAPTGTTRRIWENTLALPSPLVLTAGTYWFDFNIQVTASAANFTPSVTIPGTRGLPGWDALQRTTTGWAPIIDTGNPASAPDVPQDLPFQILGTSSGGGGPVLSISPGSVSFGNVNTGSTATTTVTLTNTGTETLTISSITISGSPAVTINQTGTQMSLAPSASTTFQVMFDPTAAGAASATITVVSNSPASPNTIMVSGTGVAPSTAVTFTSSDTPIAIPDNIPAGITSTIVIPATETRTIMDLDVNVRITHTWVGDLIGTLTRGAQTATLFSRPGTPANPIGGGCSGNDMNLFLDDEGTSGSIQANCVSGANPAQAYMLDGRYTPNTPLSVFDGTAMAGSYALNVSDNAGIDTGTLNSWALIIEPSGVSAEGGPEADTRLAVLRNPVAGDGQLMLRVATSQDVRVALYDALGREVAVLLERTLTAGQEAHIAFRTAGLAPGVYVVRAQGSDLSLAERVTVVR